MVKRLIQTVLLMLSVLVHGCSDHRLEPLTEGAIILAFGDSLTAGVGAAEPDSYPAVLARLSNRQVISAGVSGEVSARGLERLPETLRQAQPDLMILLHGGNDILRSHPAAVLEQNLNAMIELAKAAGVQVVLVGVPERKLFSDASPVYARLAEQHDLVFIESLLSDLLHQPGMKSDAVHLNPAGYRALAEGIHEVLQQEGAL
ncbi:arylesterase [Marinobacterium sediminicola]|uniref:Lysophospholipase L1 n=1 Tax=Marinobacterium sediminicola TaxID=518898 RepID=A0ABY1RWJ1_9GAMM|nr:arylesterase [Marinobacterium sediminicola]ULG70419.1 arylesterase [Marinobacterium sediminicola]SMR69407.1 Lysophospholipase L1 [Marinobacterium sediminicola]